jgi:hypothetical protein
MKRLHIRGLVRIADRTRLALASPVSSLDATQLREHALDAIRTVDAIVAKHGLRVEQLPTPTRNAYRYLAAINWASVQPDAACTVRQPKRGEIRFTGLSSFFDGLLHELGGLEPKADTQASFEAIRRTAERLTGSLTKDAMDKSQLTLESRGILSWLAFFGRRENFDRLVSAIRHTRSALAAAFEQHRSFQLPVAVHFRPMKGLYRVRRSRDATVVRFPTPMISFDADGLAHLAALICGDTGARRPILERMASRAYQAMLAELEDPASGVRSVGAFHDLDAAFQRVTSAYFASGMAKPRLVWSRRITSCKFGHYDPVRDELMVSATLDSRDVPSYVIDFVVYHELLHKKHGATWQNGRQAVHTSAFRGDERCFAEYAAAEETLKQLAKRLAS